ncbi:MAG: glycosyltransferase [Actinomycetota bacterium]|jgi:glycosyltransferase involved in cell wall biosynthesis
MPSSEPLVSVLLPAYNAESFVGDAIESVLAQTLASFELVIVNDGSTDSTATLLDRYCSDPRVRIIDNGSNRGLVASLNRGLAECRSELVARLDADDTSEPTRLERQFALFEKNQRLVLSATAYRRVRPDGSLIRVGHPPSTHAELAASHLTGNRLCHSAVMFRRRAVIDAGGYRAEWFPVEDFDLWLRLCTAGEFTAVTSEEVVYLDNPDGISATRAAHQQQMTQARVDLELSRLSGLSIDDKSSNVQRVRAAARARRALRDDLVARGIASSGLDAAMHRTMMTMLAEQPRLARHVLIGVTAPRTLLSAKVRRQSGQRDA